MKLLARIRYLLRQRQAHRDLAEEIEFHRQMSGDPAAMGNITRAREDSRAVWIWPWLESLWQDLRYAVRNLRRSPGFALVALLTLGTAIGLNTSFFTVFNAIALRPWPVKDPARVAQIFSRDPHNPAPDSSGISVAEYRYFREHARSFSGFSVSLQQEVNFGFEPFGRPSRAVLVGGDYFRVLGLQMHLGRGFLPEEDRPGTLQGDAPQAVAVLSFPFWRDHFGSDPAIVGKRVTLNDLGFTVVGVTPEDFTGTADGGMPENVYLPLSALLLLHPGDPAARQMLTGPDACCRPALGRLTPGASRRQAAAELEVLDKQFAAQSGLTTHYVFSLTGSALLDRPTRRSQAAPILALLFIGVTLVVLLACANVGNLLVARAGARQKEIEIRRTIGASRGRIVRQLLTEGLLLSLGSVALALPIAYRLPGFIIASTGEAFALHFTPDTTVLAYAIALAVSSCIGFALLPALHGTRTSSPRRLPLRNLLLALQAAFSVVLLIGAGLALQGIAHVRQQDPGFRVDGVSVVSFELPAHDYEAPRAAEFDRQLLSGLSGQHIFGITALEPLSNGRWLADFRLAGQPENAARSVVHHEVTAGYFDLLRIPILAGRNLEPQDFEPADRDTGAILVNESLARAYFNGESPLGRGAVSVGGHPRTIVGLVRDAYTEGLDRAVPIVYVPFSATYIPKVLIPPSEAPFVAALAKQIEPDARIQGVPLQASVDRWFRVAQIGAEIAGMLGVYALILATVGMSGVFAYVVQQRAKEIGIRVALGARPGQVIRLVLAESSRAVIAGLAFGLVIALFASRLMRNLLYGVSPLNPVAYLSVACLFAIAALAASYAPARRASRVDPLQALRHE